MEEATVLTRYVGTIADGATDHQALHASVRSAVPDRESLIAIRLGQTIRDQVNEFGRGCSTAGRRWFCDTPAERLRQRVVAALIAAMDELQSHAHRAIGPRDLIVLSTDSEQSLRSRQASLEDHSVLLPAILMRATEEFYERRVGWGYQRDVLPLVVPFVTFPSIDLVVAAAKVPAGESFAHWYGLRPRQMKRELYGVEDLRLLPAIEFGERGLAHITREACGAIYQRVPAARPLLRIAGWLSSS
ncbi:MAG: hypothetical protein FJX75_15575 [Armatimonadetes bacterium]|nr:hypothetical protein [Armatimonadota bacterium]